MINQLNTKFNKIQITIFSSLLLALVSQVHLKISSTGFRISLAVVFLASLLLIIPKLNSIAIGLFSGIFISVFRLIIDFMHDGSLMPYIIIYMPVFFFYATYGILFNRFIKKRLDESFQNLLLPLIFIDFSSNCFELIVRIIFQESVLNLQLLSILIVTAFIRSLLILLVYQGLKFYQSLINQEKEKEQIQELIIRMSELKSERYLLDKNKNLIEDIMNSAYSLYEDLSAIDCSTAIQNKALSIAKNVHEVKKDYISTIQGLNEMTATAKDYKLLSFEDILDVLKTYKHDTTIDYQYNISKEISAVITDKHYELVSIFRNLINNAKESFKNTTYPSLTLSITKDNQNYIFCIQDNGAGIKETNIGHIFKPGFSTNFDHETGNMNRGIGLTLVKDIVENELGGRIDVQSTYTMGTKFIITIPKNVIEVK